MSRLGCPCGETIYDTTDCLPYKGYLTPDAVYLDLFERAMKDVKAFLQARESGLERQWISSYFSSEYPSLTPEAIIDDIYTRHLFPAHRIVYQCPSCQRVLIERQSTPSHHYCFAPEDTPNSDVFTSPESA